MHIGNWIRNRKIHGSMDDSQFIVFMTRKASLLKHISFVGRKMSKRSIAKALPELDSFLKHFSPESIQGWRTKLTQHNESVHRALQMKLLRGASWLRLSSFDAFILLFQSDILADILDSHVTFANRIRPLIRANPSAHGWYFHDKMLIQRRDWKLLARRVLNLVKLLGCADPGGVAVKDSSAHHNDDECMDGWPHQERLRESLRRAAGVYGAYAIADDYSPTLPPPRPRPYASGSVAVPPRGDSA